MSAKTSSTNPSDELTGSSSNEAQQRLKTEGLNTLPSAKPRSLLAIAWAVVCEPRTAGTAGSRTAGSKPMKYRIYPKNNNEHKTIIRTV
ncbi:cation-transporting P-type ATPase [Paraglaciecola sp.]|uniref:cation-transporting P-type ATPase n=1 Tax=Paraglaciecola sp. TaxID=1920173 RepID=UPI0030F4102C